ncbi:hypothetical protein [Calothrix sp. NIES-2098]
MKSSAKACQYCWGATLASVAVTGVIAGMCGKMLLPGLIQT